MSTQPNSIKVLIVEDEKVTRDSFRQVLAKEGYFVEVAENGQRALERVNEESFEVVLLALKMPQLDGMETLRVLKEKDPDVVSLMITGYPTIESALQAVKMGAYDYVIKPCSPDELRVAVARAAERRKLIFTNEHLRRRLEANTILCPLVGDSKSLRFITEIIPKIAPTGKTVFITGESGTGKKLVAQTIHHFSSRKEKEFLALDCRALEESHLESELFGHVQGSFSEAGSPKHGLFELANGGTFFLDEVGHLTLDTQSKLLRLIQDREIKPVGGTQRIPVDVRIIAASSQNLLEATARRSFSKDLYYRLNAVPIHLPPLRERKEDIPLLVQHFIQQENRKRGKKVLGVTAGAMEILVKYNWPGNVQEMENIIEHAMILEAGESINTQSLPWLYRRDSSEVSAASLKKIVTLEEMEKKHIEHVLKQTAGHKSKTGKILGIDRKTLYNKLQKYHL